nr:hypothetical protein [Tanacetum cinerariifolium]
GSFNHLQARCKYHQRERMVNRTNHSRVNHNANTVLEAMLTRTGLKPVNSVRPVNPKRNFQRRASYDNRNFFKNVNTTKEKVNTARPNSAVLNAVRANKGKAGHSHKLIEDQGYFDSGCSWHMIRNNPTSLTSKSLMEGMLYLGEELKVKSSVKISTPVKESNGAPLIEDWGSDEEDEVKSPPEKDRKNVEPSVDKVEVEIPKQNVKPARRP